MRGWRVRNRDSESDDMVLQSVDMHLGSVGNMLARDDAFVVA